MWPIRHRPICPTAAEIFVRQRCYEEPRPRTACETTQFHPSSPNQIDTALFLKTEKTRPRLLQSGHSSEAEPPCLSIDKSAALSGRLRTSEDTLLVVGLLGGWPGALIAQKLLRHKSRKGSFQLLFWGTVALNCLLFGRFWSSR